MTSPMKSQYVYVTYIKTTPEKLWAALTKPGPLNYWFDMTQECDWKIGAPWRLKFEDGRIADQGEVLELVPNKRLVLKWRNEFRPEMKAEGYSQCTMEIEETDGAVKFTVIHGIDVDNAQFINAVSGGWPKVLSNLKSVLETGDVALKSNTMANSA